MMWGNWGSGWIWPVILVMAVMCVAMMAGMMRHGGSAHMRRPNHGNEDAPERILAKRLARGEIDVEEFERLRDALQPTSSSTADDTTGR
jgi:putative membrane protein